MKTLVVVAAGAADRPQDDLGGRTPLEAAQTPHLDRLAREGRLGRVTPAPGETKPEEGAFALALFGLDPAAHAEVGATLDAAAFGVPVGSLDQAFRLALVTAHEDTIFDPTAGHISRDEAAVLLRSLTDGIADPDFVFAAGDGWRNLLVWRGARDVRVKTLPPYDVVGRSLKAALPRGTGVARLVSAVARSADLLAGHEVNECRADLRENPATLAWPWGPGVVTPLPDFLQRTGVSAAAVGVNPTFMGAALLQGVRVVPVEGATGTVESGLRAKSDAAVAALEEHDLVFLHVDAAAEASHSRDFVAKVAAIERIDAHVLAPALREIESRRDTRVLVVGGEAVAVDSGRHLLDPVPFAMFGPGVRSHRGAAFSEVAAREGGFLIERAHELVDFALRMA
jgi:2,3-bisphosphoglycerate-independent phosphoglycerate mutase